MDSKKEVIRMLKNRTCSNCNHLLMMASNEHPICSRSYHALDYDCEGQYWVKRNETDGWTLDEIMAREG